MAVFDMKTFCTRCFEYLLLLLILFSTFNRLHFSTNITPDDSYQICIRFQDFNTSLLHDITWKIFFFLLNMVFYQLHEG